MDKSNLRAIRPKNIRGSEKFCFKLSRLDRKCRASRRLFKATDSSHRRILILNTLRFNQICRDGRDIDHRHERVVYKRQRPQDERRTSMPPTRQNQRHDFSGLLIGRLTTASLIMTDSHLFCFRLCGRQEKAGNAKKHCRGFTTAIKFRRSERGVSTGHTLFIPPCDPRI